MRNTEGLNIMYTLKKIAFLILISISSQSFSGELADTLQKACTTQQLKDHKDMKGHSFTDEDFDEYCKCETDFVLNKATEAQRDLISKKPADNPQWLRQLKSKAINNCVKQEFKKTT